MKTLYDVRLISKLTKTYEQGVKILASGKEWFAAKIDIEVSKVSPAAREAIERNGGTVREVYYHKLALQRCLREGTELPPPQEYRTD